MRKWSVLITLTYFLFIVIFSYPIVAFFFGLRFTEFINVEITALIVAVLLLVGHFSLFGIQIKLAENRLVKKRGITISIIVCSLLFTLLFFFAYIGISSSLFGDNLFPGSFLKTIEHTWVSDYLGWILLLFWIGIWLFWGLVFRRYSRRHSVKDSFNRLLSALLAGSLIEMLIAIPSHIITRNRHDCCAPAFNLIGLGTGLAIFFLVMGPGVLYLFRKKIREKRNHKG